MKLYHGTTSRYLESILANGLLPRKKSRIKTNWPEHPSHTEVVYLTDCYAPYFAAHAGSVVGTEDERWVILEVDVALEQLLPDEDYLEQMSRTSRTVSMKEATEVFKRDLKHFKNHAKKSLTHLGTVCSEKHITPDQISRVAVFDYSSNMAIAMMAMDPSISITNHYFMCKKYEALTKWFFDSNVHPSELYTHWHFIEDEKVRRAMTNAIENRSGLQLIEFK